MNWRGIPVAGPPSSRTRARGNIENPEWCAGQATAFGLYAEETQVTAIEWSAGNYDDILQKAEGIARIRHRPPGGA